MIVRTMKTVGGVDRIIKSTMTDVDRCALILSGYPDPTGPGMPIYFDADLSDLENR